MGIGEASCTEKLGGKSRSPREAPATSRNSTEGPGGGGGGAGAGRPELRSSCVPEGQCDTPGGLAFVGATLIQVTRPGHVRVPHCEGRMRSPVAIGLSLQATASGRARQVARGRPNGARSPFMRSTAALQASPLTSPILPRAGTDAAFCGSGNCGSRRPSDLLKVTQAGRGRTEVRTHRRSIFELGPVGRRAWPTLYAPRLCGPGCRGFCFCPVRISGKFVLLGFCAHEVPFRLDFVVSYRLADRMTINVFSVLRFPSLFLVVNL